MDNETFKARLRQALDEKHLTQKDFAQKLKRSPSTVKYWLSGQCSPKSQWLYDIHKALGVSIDWLLGITDRAGLTTNEFEANGIRWQQVSIEGSDELHKSEIQDGIDFFCKLLSSCKQTKDIGDWRKVYTTIKVALQSNAIRITHIDRLNAIEKQISGLFPQLRGRVYVAKLPMVGQNSLDTCPIRAELVAHLAAVHAFPRYLKGSPYRYIGVGSGYTTLRLAQLSPYGPGLSGTTWVPLMTFRNRAFDEGGLSANCIAASLAQRHPDTKALYLPYLDAEQRQHLGSGRASSRPEIAAEEILMYGKAAFPMFLSVSGGKPTSTDGRVPGEPFRTADYGISYSEAVRTFRQLAALKRDGEIGCEILGMLLDQKGDLVQSHDQNSYFGYGAALLREAAEATDVWCVAARPHKAPAVYAALTSGLVSGLVIDEDIANFIVQKKIH